ncbi:hypothetical protein FN846DRAFT_886784 [Sphaerosporella brunnea]|uniref:Uncharacterized protein n=1 Tax=Sphaerosporella brunnea TaxID=1250544 RepID=A0A5J5F8B9_9PEZI|nr:hypothetical protein FN846DRAFT_886784 [Sphaerosporella brunnea]
MRPQFPKPDKRKNVSGKTLTPCRRGAIIALRFFDRANPLTIRQIASAINVPKSTVQDVCAHAVKKQREQREKERMASAPVPAPDPVPAPALIPGITAEPEAASAEPAHNATDSVLEGIDGALDQLSIVDPEAAAAQAVAEPNAEPVAEPANTVVDVTELVHNATASEVPEKRLVAEEEVPLGELLAASKPGVPTGRPPKLTEVDKDELVAIVKRDWATRHMSLVEIKQTAGPRFENVSETIILAALHERGIKAYREDFKFILKAEDKLQRLVYCQERKDWLPDKEWARYGFTAKMSIEIGGTYGVSRVWREKGEQYEEDCRGATKKNRATVMVWGFIKWGCKGPFYIWSPETEAEQVEAREQIAKINQQIEEEENRLNAEWKKSREWAELREKELRIAREIRAAALASNTKAPVTTQSFRGKKHKLKRIVKGDGKGIDAWRYNKYVCRPILWPTCKRLLEEDPGRMKEVLQEEWDRITIEEINREISRLPKVMARCIADNGGNNFHR